MVFEYRLECVLESRYDYHVINLASEIIMYIDSNN